MKKRSKILIVDDSRTTALALKQILQDAFQVETALTGEAALEIGENFQPDLILLDIVMPGIDGFETCSRIRATPSINRAKIILLSARGPISERLKGYDAGADDFILKPFDENELLAKVRVYLRLKSVEEIDQLKGNLLTFLHHETNTPLNSIIVPIETLLEDTDMDVDNRQKWLQMSYDSALRLQNLFEKVITLCSMKSHQVQFNFETADLCSIIRDAILKIKAKADKRKVTVNSVLPTTAITKIDRVYMGRVISSIFENAVRFSTLGGKVDVKIITQGKDFCINITDNGKGIDPEYIPFVFDEFTDSNIKHHSEGHGLSMAIAKYIVLEHHGDLDVTNTPNTGATFKVKIPIEE